MGGVKANNTMNNEDNRGRLFVMNDDLTISPKYAQHLVLGANFEKRGFFSRLFESRERDAAPAGAASSQPVGTGGTWTEHKNIDMCGQGDVKIVHNWRARFSIDDL